MLIDTHCHLDFKDFDADRDDVIDRSKRAGVARIINVGSSLEGSRRAVELAGKHDLIYASIGIHPHDAAQVTGTVIEELRILAKDKKVVAIGEVGLDYYRNLSPRDVQQAVFRRFIQLSLETDLPLIIHSRQADDDTILILKECGRPVKGVMHCFSGGEKMLKECLDLGLHISFTCNLTFKNAGTLREVAGRVPIEKVLLETDAPFLAPEGMRGKRNEPANLVYLVDEWARLSGLSRPDIERITTHNANALFRLGLSEENSKIAYQIRDSLYLNITNECTNNCYFCIRAKTAFVKGHNLKLEREPGTEEILSAIGDPRKYKEIAFCGYGEPTTRLETLKAVAKKLKESGAVIRLVTNGHGDLINNRPIAKELAGLVDKVSVSLNADRKEDYYEICKPKFGPETHGAVIDFIRDCVDNGIRTEVTCLGLPRIDIKKCEKIAKTIGAEFRPRIYGVTG